MGAAWFLAWLAHVVPEWLFLTILFGVPVAVILFGVWQGRR